VSVSRPWIKSNLKLSTMGAAQVSLADVMATAAMILIFLIGGHRVLGGELTVGTLVAFYTLANRLYRPISGLIDVNIDLQMARASLARVYALVDKEPEVRDPADPAPLPPAAGRLELAGVGLVYPGGSRVLDRVDLEIEAGQSVALVGPSGSGKSTLSALLARYLDPTQGAVRLDGVDLRAIRLRELRKRVGLVPQETLLFHDTVAANLRLARPDATDGKLVEVLSDVALGDFLAGLPEGLDTIVGAQGLRLSGGERQRLALARALLKDAPLLILDEATSALDPGTERRVLSRLFEQRAGRTTILIAHRLTSITDVDRILVLSDGRLVQTGTHDELYRRPGLYRALWDDQSRRQETG
jgi:ATP-binding cassette subfamily B protein